VLKFFGAADGVADEMPFANCARVIEIDQRVIPKGTNFLVEVRTSTIDLARQQPRQQRMEPLTVNR
jgi:hypothetical protein